MSPSPILTAAPPNIPSAPNSAALPPDSVASTPRASVSREDLHHSDFHDLKAKAKRWAQWSRSHERGRGSQEPTGSAGETAVLLSAQDGLEETLLKFRQNFTLLFPDWAPVPLSQSLQANEVKSLEDLLPRIESNLDRIGSFSRGQDGAGKSLTGGTSHWESTKAHIQTLEKLDSWLKRSSHPFLQHVLNSLWRGIGSIFDFMDQAPGVGWGAFDHFCRALQEVSVVLPSTLYHVSGSEILSDEQVEAVTGLIYADILELVGSIVQDVFIPLKPHAGSSSSGGIRQTLLGKGKDHSHHSTRRNSSLGISINTNVPPATGSTPTSPTGNIATKKQLCMTQWKQHLRLIIEQIGYHSKLLHSELNHLKAREQSGRFWKIDRLLNDVEEAGKRERDYKKKLQSLGTNTGGREQPHRRGSDTSESSEGPEIEDATGDGNIGIEKHRAELIAQCRSARQEKEILFTKLREQAGDIKCDVCLYTGLDVPPGEQDHRVQFSANLGQFTKEIVGKGASEFTRGGSSTGLEGTTSRPLFKIFITNETTIETLKEINPRFMLSGREKKSLDECPNLWSFARLPSAGGAKPEWSFIKTTLPNLEKGFGSEARRYAMEARDETSYFYDTTWKIYWCQPRSHQTFACPVAILVLAGDDVPLSRPIDSSPKALNDTKNARDVLVAHYRAHFHLPLIEHGAVVRADNLAVQILGETKRRWREVLDKTRHFIDVLTEKLYVQASNSSLNAAIGVVRQREAAEALSEYNHAAAQVFKILIRVNRYESMFIETMSYISQLADHDVMLGGSRTDLLQFHEEDNYALDDGADPQSAQPYSRTNTRSLSRSGLLRTGPIFKVNWRDIKRGHSDLLESLKSTKRQAESLKALIDHQHSMYESRVSNQHSMVANWHAAEATRAADEAAAQNASMRRLTVVTFIFLPLTFMASMFGTNVSELGQGDVPLWKFFAVGIPFAGIVLAAWAYLEFWGQRTSSDGKGGELSERSRVEEIELELQRQAGLPPDRDTESAGIRRPWEGGDRMV